METPTPTGGIGPNNIIPMSPDQAGEALFGLLGTQEVGGEPETKEATHPEATETSATPKEAEAPVEAKTTEAETPTESAPTFETLDELAEATGLPMETLLNLKTRAKIDGEESTVPLAQLLKSYQLEGHLNRKNMELAETRKAFEAEQENVRKEFQGRLQQADTLIKTLEEQFMKDMNAVDWQTLRATDPAEYSARRQDYIERNIQIQNLKNNAQFEAQRLNQELTQKQQTAYQDFVKKETEVLMTKLPDWSDPTKASTEKAKLRNYLKTEGFQDAEIGGIADHRAILLARKAMLYDEMSQKAAVATKKVTPLPKFQKPGVKQSDTGADKQKETFNRLHKSGRIEDAADLIEQRLFKG